MQRFGTSDISTHAVGIAIFQRDFKRAVEYILADRSGDLPDGTKARKLYREGKYSAALDAMPRAYTGERGILGKMAKDAKANNGKLTNDWLGYLLATPRQLRTMYVHAYQSYVWNRMVSERMKRGREVMAGDIVAANKEQSSEQATEDVDGDADADAAEDTGAAEEKVDERAPIAVKILTQEDLASYTMHDVLIPMPGAQVKLPEGWMTDMYEAELAREGLKLEDLFSQASS